MRPGVSRDWRETRIAELEQMVRERDALIAELRRQNARLEQRVAKLEERLQQSSRNSSQPPSSDGPAAAASRPRKAPSGRKPGGQPGHQKCERALVPPDQVDQSHDCIPERCEQCGLRLRGRDSQPRIHQVWHLPVIRPLVWQYLLHALSCDHCGHVTRGRLPDGVPSGAFGPSVVAVIALLMGAYRIGKRGVQDLLSDLFGLQLSLGAVVGCQQAATAALAAPVQEAADFARRQPVKHADETSWKEGAARAKAWLWTLATPWVTVFMIHRSRGSEAAKALLGRVKGALVSDRWSAYSWWPLCARQVCWSHLVRDFTAIAERGGESGRIGTALLKQAELLFHYWHRIRDGTLKRRTFVRHMRKLERRVRALLQQGVSCAHPRTAGTCAKLLTVFPALWLFVRRRGVEPTNNFAERAVRHPVMWRRICAGTHSEFGSRFVERILTAVVSLRQQQRNVLDFLRAACEAELTHAQPPSLLPASAVSRRTSQLPLAA
jgi:transposase